jgi:hypothetical protein
MFLYLKNSYQYMKNKSFNTDSCNDASFAVEYLESLVFCGGGARFLNDAAPGREQDGSKRNEQEGELV